MVFGACFSNVAFLKRKPVILSRKNQGFALDIQQKRIFALTIKTPFLVNVSSETLIFETQHHSFSIQKFNFPETVTKINDSGFFFLFFIFFLFF